MGRDRAARREARKAREQEFQEGLRKIGEIYRGTGAKPDLFGRAQASSKEIADAMHQRRGRIEQG